VTRLTFSAFVLFLGVVTTVSLSQPGAAQTPAVHASAHVDEIFLPSTRCTTCHGNLTTPAGEDVSFGTMWRASMMAHAARDPYWHAGVRREVMDHPTAQAEIENQCARCHMPMAYVRAQAQGRQMSVFANLPISDAGTPADPLAADGVSCTVCHQITSDRLGQKESFSGGFTIDTTTPIGQRRLFGPYGIDRGRTALMRSATGFAQTTAAHIQQSEVCATCHTVYNRSLDASGKPIGEFPEQVPYLEWLQSDLRRSDSCQSCHMPVVDEPTPISSALGELRLEVSRHDFRGANFFMLGLLNRFRADLGVVARPAELDASAMRTKAYLQASAATVEVTRAERVGRRLEADILVRNLGGHKLPTAFPSRRVWLAMTVRNESGRILFSSGEVEANGAIAGNDNDQDGSRVEPHYREIRSADQVQIYEAIMATPVGAITTGVLSAVTYAKDNRLLPRGFDKRKVPVDVAVHGGALDDPDFEGGQDRVRYSIDVASAQGPLLVEVQLWYQPIAYRWVENLRTYDAVEPRRFADYFDEMSSASALILTRAARTISEP
jgi:hypothetical protein